MKRVNTDTIDKFNKLKDIIKDRGVFLTYVTNFGSDPVGVIDKLKDEPLLGDSDRKNFYTYKKGLIGINTKDTTITMALKYLKKIIKSYNSKMDEAIDELSKEFDILTIKENVETLKDILDKDLMANNLNTLKNNLPMKEYANNKIEGLMGVLTGNSLTLDEYMTYLVSIIDTINVNLTDGISYKEVNTYVDTMNNNITNIKAIFKIVKENIDKEILYTDKVALKDNISVDGVDITTDKITDYIEMSAIKSYDVDLSTSIANLYIDINEAESVITSIVNNIPTDIYETIRIINKKINKLCVDYVDDEVTDEIFIKYYKEYTNLFNHNYNLISEQLVKLTTSNIKLNKTIYMVYLTKSFLEQVMVEATIK